MRAIFAIVFFSALIISAVFLKEKKRPPLLKPQQDQTIKASSISQPQEVKSTAAQLVLQFSKEISQIQNDPVAAELNMKTAAQSLPESDYAILEKMILDSSRNQDDRFVALTLLSWSNNSNVASTLVNVATASFDPLLNPNQKSDFEQILRMRAVEGLSEIPLQPYQRVEYLNQIVAKTELKLVSDRAMRSLWAEQKLAKSAVDQDQDALEKLLSSP